jgi:hypothetical protein
LKSFQKVVDYFIRNLGYPPCRPVSSHHLTKTNNDFTINTICEIPWHVFLEHKKWHKTMGAWNIQLTKKVIESSRVLT